MAARSLVVSARMGFHHPARMRHATRDVDDGKTEPRAEVRAQRTAAVGPFELQADRIGRVRSGGRHAAIGRTASDRDHIVGARCRIEHPAIDRTVGAREHVEAAGVVRPPRH